jgi:hypothetical protein
MNLKQDGAFCNAGGEMSAQHFEQAMRMQLRLYLQVI